jgi:heat shock protein HslJ
VSLTELATTAPKDGKHDYRNDACAAGIMLAFRDRHIVEDFPMLKNRVGCALALGFVLCIAWTSRPSANEEFPFGRELLLDARPMKGSKRIPGIEIDVDGTAAIALWCNTLQGRAVVSADAITISTGEKTDRPCTPDRAQADDDLAAALAQVTRWRWEGESLVMDGTKELRFRLHTN